MNNFVECSKCVMDTTDPEISFDENEKKIDILIGALLMQQWGIALIPEKEDN